MRTAIAAALLLATLAPPAAAATEREFTIYLHDQGSSGADGGRLHLLPEIMNAEVGDTLKLTVINAGSTIHNVMFCGDGEDFDQACSERWGGTRMLQPNETAPLSVEVQKAGRFDYYCEVAGHKAGMNGTLVVAGDAAEPKSAVPFGPLALLALAAVAVALGRRLR